MRLITKLAAAAIAVALTAGTANSTVFAGTIAGFGGFTKQGSGTLTLSGVNSYAGPTVVDAGTLEVRGQAAADSLDFWQFRHCSPLKAKMNSKPAPSSI